MLGFGLALNRNAKITLDPTPTPFFEVLSEDDFFLITEDNKFIILELD